MAAAPTDTKAPRPLFRRFMRWLDRRVVGATVTSLVALITLVVMAPTIIYSVPAGHGAVLWKRFAGGTVVERVYGEGLHVIYPWDHFFIYDLRAQLRHVSVDVLMADGLSVLVDVAFRYKLAEPTLGLLHKYIGPNYLEVVLAADVATETRHALARVRAEELYSHSRAEYENIIANATRHTLEAAFDFLDESQADFVRLQDVLIRSVLLPESVRVAIERKNEELQLIQQVDFRIQVEDRERLRKIVEAQGIRSFQEIVSGGLTEQFLRWRGIEATVQLAQSNNAKVVVIGSGATGMPLILGGLDQSGTAVAAATQAGVPSTTSPAATPSALAGGAVSPNSLQTAPSMAGPLPPMPERTAPQRPAATAATPLPGGADLLQFDSPAGRIADVQNSPQPLKDGSAPAAQEAPTATGLAAWLPDWMRFWDTPGDQKPAAAGK